MSTLLIYKVEFIKTTRDIKQSQQGLISLNNDMKIYKGTVVFFVV